MDIRDRRALKDDAAQALARGRDPKKLILAYAGASTLIALVVTLLDYWLEQQISDTGGLRNLGTRSILSTIQTVLPLLQSFALLCMDYGYLSAVLRISRRQYADHTDMKNGLGRIGPIIRLLLLQGLLYLAVGMVSYNIGMLVFLLSPLSDSFAQVVLPYISDAGIDVNGLLDEAVLAQMTTTLIPMLVIVAAVFLVLALPLAYRFRMAGYRLMDEPRTGAFAALRDVNYVKSARLMGAGSGRILLVHMLPNTVHVLLPAITIGFNNAVLAEASMSYLGIGVTPPDASLGYMLSEAQSMFTAAPWYAVCTGATIILLVFGVGLIGEGLQRRTPAK